jgi:hypothetical protein
VSLEEERCKLKRLTLLTTVLAVLLIAAAPALAQSSVTVNEQTCAAFFGDQTATQSQYDSDGSAQGLTQAQIQECRQLLANATAGGSGHHHDDGGDAVTLNAQTCAAFFGDQDATQIQDGSDGSVQILTQAQVQYCLQVIQNVTAGGGVHHGDGHHDDHAHGGDATTLNAQQCIAIFGDQDATQIQYDSDGSFQGLTQTQVQYCLQVIQNITAGGTTTIGHDDVVFDHAIDQYVIEGTETIVVFDHTVDAFVVEHSGVVGTEGFALLPDTGGISLLVLGAGALLVSGGLLVRRIAR